MLARHLKLCFLAALIAACCIASALSAAPLATATPPLRCGVPADTPPYGHRDSRGIRAGFTIDLARVLAGRMDLPGGIELVAGTPRSLTDLLLEGRLDVVLAPVPLADGEFARLASLSLPLVVAVRMVAAGNRRPGIVRPAEANDRRYVVAVPAGTLAEAAARRLLPEARLVFLPAVRDALLMVADHAADAAVAEEAPLLLMMKAAGPALGDATLLPDPLAAEPHRILVRLEDTGLRDRLRTAIRAIEADGSLKSLRLRWLVP